MATTAIAAAPAVGASTRAEYITQVDPICNQADRDIKRALRGFTPALKRGQLPAAGRKYARADRIFERSIADVASVEPPPADTALIDDWLGLHRRDAALPIAQALKRRHARRAAKLFGRSAKLERRASRLMSDYGFEDCA